MLETVLQVVMTKPQVAVNTKLRARGWVRNHDTICNAEGKFAIMYKADGNIIVVYPDGTFDRKDNGPLRLRAGFVNRSEANREYERKLRSPVLNVEQVARALTQFINSDVRRPSL